MFVDSRLTEIRRMKSFGTGGRGGEAGGEAYNISEDRQGHTSPVSRNFQVG